MKAGIIPFGQLQAAAAAALFAATSGCSAATSADRPRVEYFPPDAATQAAVRATGTRAPFSGAVRVGDVLYLSGQIGLGADRKLPEGIEAQAAQTMENIRSVLASAGLGFEDVFRCVVMIENMADWPAFNRVYLRYFDGERLPARSAFGTDGLALGALVEVECQAHFLGDTRPKG